MKNKEFHKLLKKNHSKPNSGFTLTELLVGLFMSIFVIGALGFGLMQMLRVTQKGDSETAARNESSRALDFISDEMRRAQAIEVDNSIGHITQVDDAATPDIDESIAPNYSLPTGGTVRLALQIPGVDQRVIYSVAPPESTSPWKGPNVIYRWGPDLTADGSYVTDSTKAGRVDNPAGWTNEALVDGVSNEDVIAAGCDIDGTAGDDTYKGFYACVVDDDGDGTAGEAEDSDGKAITAQLYFTGETKGADGISTGTYSADTKTVARARTAPGNNSDDFREYITSYKSLGAVYGCKPTGGGAGVNWEMRTDFINNPSDPDSEAGNKNKKWIHDDTRQPQPIKISTDQNLVINSIPVNQSGSASDCISKGGSSSVTGVAYGNESITSEADSVYYKNGSNYVDASGNPSTTTDADGNTIPLPVLKQDIHVISHEIDFNNPATFNGYDENNPSANGNPVVKTGETETNATVLFLRPDDEVPDNAGYDVDGSDTTTGDVQDSLREFLNAQGYLKSDGITVDPAKLGKNERIVVIEIGQTDISHPGFDRQDNIFILSSDIFAENAP